MPAHGSYLLVPTGVGGEKGPGAVWAVCRLTRSQSCMPRVGVGDREIPVGTVASVDRLAAWTQQCPPTPWHGWGGELGRGQPPAPQGTPGVSSAGGRGCSTLLFPQQTGRLEQLLSCQEGV